MAKRHKVSGWRKLSTSTWGPPNDPQIFGDLELDAGPALAFIEEARATGAKVTMTHMVGKSLAYALGENRDLNVKLVGDRFVEKETVDVFFIASVGQGEDLSGVKVVAADAKPVVEIAGELSARAGRIRSGTDAEFGRTKKMLERTPRRALRHAMRLAAWLTSNRNVDLPKYGLPRDAFGSVMVSSVGMFGIQHAYAPLSPYYKIPLLVLVSEVTRKPVVVDDEIVIRPMVGLAATLDHRYLDGFHAARLARSVKEYMGDPKRLEPAL